VVSVLDSGAEGTGFESQLRRCRVTVLGKLFTPIVPLPSNDPQLSWAPYLPCRVSGSSLTAQTVIGVYLKSTCSRVTALSALAVLNDYALYKSTHSLTPTVASAHRGKWGQLTPLEKMDEKLKKRKHAKTAVF